MGKATYIKLFFDYLDAVEPLGDAEKGRLFTSLLEYAKTGVAPQLSGNERFLFPMMKAQVDRDRASYEELSDHRSKAGKQGGRPRGQEKANAFDEKQTKAKKANAFSESKKSYDKDNDDDYDYDKDVKEKSKRKTEFVPPTLQEVVDYCKERGNQVDPKRFWDYFNASGWVDSKGNNVRSWKQKIITWEGGANIGNGAVSNPQSAAGTAGEAKTVYGNVL